MKDHTLHFTTPELAILCDVFLRTRVASVPTGVLLEAKSVADKLKAAWVSRENAEDSEEL